MVESATAPFADAAVGSAPASSLISGSSPKISQTSLVVLRDFSKVTESFYYDRNELLRMLTLSGMAASERGGHRRAMPATGTVRTLNRRAESRFSSNYLN